MSFAVRNLSVLSYAQGFTLWHYRAGPIRLDDITSDGYFDKASDMLAAGDLMMVSGIEGGRIVWVDRTGPHVRTAPLC